MSSVTPQATQQDLTEEEPPAGWKHQVRMWFSSWELYVILLVGALLRLYRLDRTEFDSDQADIFRMAYDATHHGLFVAASNMASIHIYNPPGVVYILMLVAAFSANPLWAALLIAVLATLSVLITYIFTRHYYGRLAGALAAALYATAYASVFYSRFIWQQNLLLFFVPLFIATLFLGTVSRRKGWLFPALLLLGLLVQLHASTVSLAAALLVTWILAPGTVRWRDLLLGVVSLCVIYAPYILWEFASHFQDVAVLSGELHQPSKIDNQALLLYQQFLSPFPAHIYPHSLFYMLAPFVSWLLFAMTTLVIVAGLVAFLLFVWPQRHPEAAPARGIVKVWRGLRYWWADLRRQPYRCGLLVLLVWQGIPLLYLSRHSIALFPHYFIMLMPGPFILIGLLFARVNTWLRKLKGRSLFPLAGVYGLAALIILAQLAASSSNVVDITGGGFKDAALSYPYYNDLSSLRTAVQMADQLAQRRHLHHLYVSTDFATETALHYLITQAQTPTTAFSDTCQVLPASSEGPVVMLLGPHSDLSYNLLPRYASATLVTTSPHLGGPPFRIYIVQSFAPQKKTITSFPGDFQLLDTQRITFSEAPWTITHWNIQRAVQPALRVRYMYDFTDLTSPSQNVRINRRECVFTAMHEGDQMLIAFPLLGKEASQSAITVQVKSYSLTPFVIAPHFLHSFNIAFETGFYQYTSQRVLRTVQGQERLILPTF